MDAVNTGLDVGGKTLGMGAGLTAALGAIPGWGWAALAGANLLGSVLGSNAQARQREKEGMIRAAEIEASPWTKQAPSTQISTPQTSAWSNLIGAGTNVLAQGQALQKSMIDTEKEKRAQSWNEMMMKKAAAGQVTPEQAMIFSNFNK